MQARRALEEMALLRDKLSTREYQIYADGFIRDMRNKGFVRQGISGRSFCLSEIDRLNMAETYYVSAHMVPLVKWAAAGLNGTDRFDRTLWPSEYGFMYFEDAYMVSDVWGKATSIKAMVWGRVQEGFRVSHFADLTDPRDEVSRAVLANDENYKMLRCIGKLQLNLITQVPDDLRVGPERIKTDESKYQSAFADDVLQPDSDNVYRMMLALLMLLNQTVTVVAKEPELNKHQVKRFRRMGLPSDVTVIQLRRHEGNRMPGESVVEWAHRWIVKGHWRNQPYKNDDGTIRYERIWIAPYVKGPDDKPFKQSQKVYGLVR